MPIHGLARYSPFRLTLQVSVKFSLRPNLCDDSLRAVIPVEPALIDQVDAWEGESLGCGFYRVAGGANER